MKTVKDFWKPAVLVLVFGAMMFGLYFSGLLQYFKWSVWKSIHGDIKLYAIDNMFKAIIIASFAYVLMTLSFLPGMILFDLLVGYFFPQAIAITIIITSATLSSLVICAGCRFGFKSLLVNSDNKLLQRLQKGFAANETYFLLFVRFIPLFPFAFVSAALSTLKVSYKKIAWTTFIGMIPIAFIFTTIGKTLEDFMQYEKLPPISTLMGPKISVALFALCFLSLLPVIMKKYKKI